MPELPEVETIKRGLEHHLQGKKIVLARAFTPKLRFPIPTDFEKRLTENRVTGLRRRAKYILISFEDGLILLLHFGMSGQVLIQSYDNSRPFRPKKHDHFVFDLEGGSRMVFRDPRRFGLAVFSETEKVESHPLLKNLGPEPISNAFSGPVFHEALRGRKISIKQALLDQKVVAGVGNIYASEALYRAGINPGRKASSLSLPRAEKLVVTLKDVLKEAIHSGGSSLRDFVQVNGELGYFQHHFDVYDREKEACRKPACDGTIRRFVQGQRSTFYCPRCQH